jgi:uncharacterized C2H2 Zn-finger protein
MPSLTAQHPKTPQENTKQKKKIFFFQCERNTNNFSKNKQTKNTVLKSHLKKTKTVNKESHLFNKNKSDRERKNMH